jgi:hypothetical protein
MEALAAPVQENHRDVRIFQIHTWSWGDNACSVRFASDLPNVELSDVFHGPLPPFASPIALYRHVIVTDGVITDWLAGACVLDTDNARALRALSIAPKEKITLLRRRWGMKLCALKDLFAHGVAHDMQVLDFMDVSTRGVFDALCLLPAKRAQLLANYKYFGRAIDRTFKKPHTMVLPRHTDANQSGNFSRSSMPELQRLSQASPAWTAARQSATAGEAVSAAQITEAYGEEVAAILLGMVPLHAAPVAQLNAEALAHANFTADAIEYVEHVQPCNFSPSDDAHDAVIWFATNSSASQHPVRHGAPTYGVHETYGACFAVHSTEREYTLDNGLKLSVGGFRPCSQVPIAEGGCGLFCSRSLSKIGFYAKSKYDWTPELASTLLALAAQECTFYTNNLLFKSRPPLAPSIEI